MAKLGRTLRKTADELQRQIANLNAVVEVDAWDNKSGKEFRTRAKGNLKKLEAAFTRYDTAADAIGTAVTETGGSYADKLHAKYSNYASDLNRAQEIADAALRDAQGAEDRKSAAQKSLDGHSGKNSDGADRKEAEGQRDAASAEIEAAREKIGEAKKIRDEAASRACDSIDAVVNHDSLKDGFWDSLVKDIADITESIAKWAGILSLLVGWIPVIGQALAGILGAVAMIATLINVAMTLIAVLRGNEDWSELGKAALGLLMVGVGKAFTIVAGKFAKIALSRLGKAAVATTSKQIARNGKKLNKIAGEKLRISKGDMLKALKEPFTEPFSKAAWANNLKVLKPGAGNYKEAWGALKVRGNGNGWAGIPKSFSAADPGVASDLKSVKQASEALNFAAANKIAKKASVLSAIGTGITGAGYAIDTLL
ncbi:hypothetical protein [Streptomyces sp. NPDC001652]|uniref:hypothetical protein n=1 Tax=Streptomyces sp. NPDC001652 TaxID=3154393 RepID=UPI00332B14AF